MVTISVNSDYIQMMTDAAAYGLRQVAMDISIPIDWFMDHNHDDFKNYIEECVENRFGVRYRVPKWEHEWQGAKWDTFNETTVGHKDYKGLRFVITVRIIAQIHRYVFKSGDAAEDYLDMHGVTIL